MRIILIFINKNFITSDTYSLAKLTVFALSIQFSASVSAMHNKTNVPSKPNFVWIMSEDNSPEYLRLYNKEYGAATPNIESLAKQGLTFDNAYSNAPVCSTARSTLALGVYPPQAGIMHHRAFARAKYKDGLESIYQLMKSHGYYVTNNAKTDFNFDSTKGANFSESNTSAHWRNRSEDQSFFHIKTFGTTHESRLMFPISDMKNKPTKHDPAKVKLAAVHPDTELFRYTHARYLDQHVVLDTQVGDVLKELEEDGELENTFVFYFGDHGGVLPGSKSYANESGLKVPMVVRIPKNFQYLVDKNQKAGSRIDNFVNFVDMAPTLLNLAGLPSYSLHAGKAFLGKNTFKTGSDKVFGYADRFGERYDLVRTLRVGKFKYVRNYMPMNPDGLQQSYRYKNAAYQEWRNLYKKGQLSPVQAAFFEEKPAEALYDLSNDPEELNNLAEKPAHQQQLVRLRTELQQHLKSTADMGFLSESWIKRTAHKDSLQLAASQHKQINKMIDVADLMLLPFNQVKSQLSKTLDTGTESERYWALITLSYFAKEAKEAIPQVQKLLLSKASNLVKARAIEFLTRVEAIDPVEPLTQLIEVSTYQLESLEIMNIAAVLHDTFGFTFNITPQIAWSKLPPKSSPDYKPKKYQNGSVKVRIEYLKTPWNKVTNKTN